MTTLTKQKESAMTDKELLELAAKAVERNPETIGINGNGMHAKLWCESENDWQYAWNPLTSDSDAFRLATNLEIEIYHCQDDLEISEENLMRVYAGYAGANGVIRYCIESHGEDPYAATRRAITVAAAAIGKGSHE